MVDKSPGTRSGCRRTDGGCREALSPYDLREQRAHPATGTSASSCLGPTRAALKGYGHNQSFRQMRSLPQRHPAESPPYLWSVYLGAFTLAGGDESLQDLQTPVPNDEWRRTIRSSPGLARAPVLGRTGRTGARTREYRPCPGQKLSYLLFEDVFDLSDLLLDFALKVFGFAFSL